MNFRSVYYCYMDLSSSCLVTKLYLTLCNPIDCSPPGSSVHGISQARILEWAATSYSRGSFWLRDQPLSPALAGWFFTTEPRGKTLWTYGCVLSRFSRVQLFATLLTVACQAPLSVGFFRQEYGSGLPCPPPTGSLESSWATALRFAGCLLLNLCLIFFVFLKRETRNWFL